MLKTWLYFQWAGKIHDYLSATHNIFASEIKIERNKIHFLPPWGPIVPSPHGSIPTKVHWSTGLNIPAISLVD